MQEEGRPDSGSIWVTGRVIGDAVEPVALEPVDEVTWTTWWDNVSDLLLLDQGPRDGSACPQWERCRQFPDCMCEQRETVEALHAEHGFALLTTVERGDRRSPHRGRHRMTPKGTCLGLTGQPDERIEYRTEVGFDVIVGRHQSLAQ